MTKILFVCLGNICRSPMAEAVMKKLAAERGLSAEFEIASAGTSDEERGNGVYPPAARTLREKGVVPVVFVLQVGYHIGAVDACERLIVRVLQ